jgi:cellulase/cellobiase CelA1
MSRKLDGMVAVASGRSAAVKRWSQALRRTSIQFAVANCFYPDTSAPTDHAEIWVEKDDADEARSVIRNGSEEDKSLIW